MVDLSGIQAGDALESRWPTADCIIGNPPFLGASHVRGARGDAYVERLKTAFNVGIKDYCVYWFRKTHDHLAAGRRAGLVGTNSISQGLGRSASLDYIVNKGGVITDAISTQKWPGEAKVHVSLVNWVKQPPTQPAAYILDGQPVSGISAELRTPERSVGTARQLRANLGKGFEGPSPKADGFVISKEEAERLLNLPGTYADVVRPYLGSADVARDPHQRASRWAIDFGVMPLEGAMQFPEALAIVRERVKPVRDANNRAAYRRNWWQFAEPRPGLRVALRGLDRYIVLGTHGKRLFFAWEDAWTLASNATKAFAFEDDYSMGVLSSRTHEAWGTRGSSSIKADPRYTTTTSFDTFPWPFPVTDRQRQRIAAASRAMTARRQAICVENDFGLTALYNAVDDGAYTDLKAMHMELDDAVAAVYGWPKAVAHDADEVVRRLLALNLDIAVGTRNYNPFDAPTELMLISD